MFECDKCGNYGLQFNRRYKPDEFIEGKLSSDVWIIGLNPAQDESWTDSERGKDELANYFSNPDQLHPYFKDFKKVSPKLFSLFGKESGVAHTDLVKCSSRKWPTDSCKGKKADHVIDNCSPYLIQQIRTHKPKLIVCNGAPVSHRITAALKPHKNLSDTAYESKIDEETKVTVVLSGFIGRIDDFSKRRLGYEIESLIEGL